MQKIKKLLLSAILFIYILDFMKNIIHELKLNWKSGLSVAIINIPLSISLAVASWWTPIQWLLTGIWWWMFAAMFASSGYNIFWVAGALSWILASFAIINWPWLLPVIAVISGFFMLIIYYFKITKYITLIPSTALHWFLVWVGISIAVWQLNWALGLDLPKEEKIYIWILKTIKNIPNLNLGAFITFLVGIGFLILNKKKFPNFPWVIVLTFVWIGIGYLTKYWYYPKINLLADTYKSVNFTIFTPIWSWLETKWLSQTISLIEKVFSVSIIVAIIAILETVISAKIAEKMTKDKFVKDKEVFGLAMSNIASWLFGWLPSTAVFVRTSLNIKSWAKSKYSWFLAGLFTLIFSLLFFNNGFLYLPYPIIAAILINIALGLINIEHLKKLYEMEHSALYIAIITAFFTVIEDPTFWIVIWTAITLMIFLKRLTSSWAKVSVFRDKKLHNKLKLVHYIKEQENDDIILLKFAWGLNYLNIDRNCEHIEKINKKITIILSFTHMWDIDVDWIEKIEELVADLRSRWIDVYFSWLTWWIERVICKIPVYKELFKEKKVFSSTSVALHDILSEEYKAYDNF